MNSVHEDRPAVAGIVSRATRRRSAALPSPAKRPVPTARPIVNRADRRNASRNLMRASRGARTVRRTPSDVNRPHGMLATMPENVYDLIVLGGGPAGSTLASLTAMTQHRVLLLEKEKFPRHQLGESLLPATVHG